MTTWIVIIDTPYHPDGEFELWQTDAETSYDAMAKVERQYTHVQRAQQNCTRAIRLDNIQKL